jgi:hypothetical protein
MSDKDTSDFHDAGIAEMRERMEYVLESGGIELAEPALWVEPSADLEASVVEAIGGERPAAPTAVSWTRPLRWFVPLAAAAAVVIGFVTLSNPPDWTATLGATDAAPGAVAVASGWNDDDGTRVELDVEGLDPAPDGFFYELWFSRDDIHISAGSFHGTAEGVTLWAGVRRSDFPRVGITLEPIDNDPSPGVNILDTAVSTG